MTTEFVPADAEFEARVRASFARQRIMTTLGATLEHVAPGALELAMPYDAAFTQQHGFVHAGVLATLLDSACGYAAFTLMPADAAVLSIEFKLNLLAPAAGERVVARARVLRSGKNVSVCAADGFAVRNGVEKHVATMVGTMMCVRGNETLTG